MADGRKWAYNKKKKRRGGGGGGGEGRGRKELVFKMHVTDIDAPTHTQVEAVISVVWRVDQRMRVGQSGLTEARIFSSPL